MNDELRHEELLLRRAHDTALEKAHGLADSLLSERFGWTDEPPPRSGIIETNGFYADVPGFLGQAQRMMLLPGLVDASVYPVPLGTLWRPKP